MTKLLTRLALSVITVGAGAIAALAFYLAVSEGDERWTMRVYFLGIYLYFGGVAWFASRKEKDA